MKKADDVVAWRATLHLHQEESSLPKAAFLVKEALAQLGARDTGSVGVLMLHQKQGVLWCPFLLLTEYIENDESPQIACNLHRLRKMF